MSKPNLQTYLDSQVHLTPPDVRQTEINRESKYGITRSAVLTSRPHGYPTLHDQAARALTRDVLFRVGNQRLHGEHGVDGRHGAAGHAGSYGGGDGGRGQDGVDGTDGKNARSAGDVTIRVAGSNNAFQVSAQGTVASAHSNMTVDLGASKVLFVDGCGGCGGWGGHGGDGGDGGHGGAGTRGYDGANGYSASGYGARGGDGGNGGPGGPGGDGGDGGHAGDAGKGGQAGSGSKVILQAVNPQLLMLLEGDARAGIGGTAGTPGTGGSGGYGGPGGPGGSGGAGGAGGPAQYETRTTTDSNGYSSSVTVCVVSAGSSGSNGWNGPSGPDGRSGSRGKDGKPAPNGANGYNGSITYQVVREDGSIVESNRDRFNVAVLSYQVNDGNDDGIFEPGVDGGGLQLLKVVMKNNGGLTLPEGAWLHSINGHAPSGREVGLLRVDGVVQNPAIFQTNIPDVPCSIGKPHKDSLRVGTYVTLLGHAFDESKINGVVVVQFPVQVVMATSNTYMGPNESGTIEIQLINLSTRDYGDKAHQTAGAIVIDLVCDEFFELLPDRNPGGLYDYVIGQKPNTAVATVYHLKAGHNLTVRFRVHLLPGAGNVLMMALPWSATLRLRNKRIEQRDHTVRVVPKFEPNIYCDMCLITSPNMDRNEFLAWSYLVQCLELSLSIWDVERYKGIGGLGRGPPSSNGLRVGWVDRCQVVVVPRLTNQAQGGPDVATISIADACGQLGTSGGSLEGLTPVEVPTADRLNQMSVQELLSFIESHGAPTNGCVDADDLRAIAKDLVPDEKASDFVQNRTGDAFRERHAAQADVQSMITRRQSARLAIAQPNRRWQFWKKKPDFVRIENDVSLELGMPQGANGEREKLPAEGNGWGSMCMIGWTQEELWHLVFDHRYPLAQIPWGGYHLFPTCISDRAFAYHADRDATRAIRRGEKANPSRRFAALGDFAPDRTKCHRAEYGKKDLDVYESSHPRDAPFFSQSKPSKITSGSLPYTTSSGADRKVAYHVSSYTMDLSCPFAQTLIGIVLSLKPHQLIRYLSKPSHLVQFTFEYTPKLNCLRNCCRAITCGDKPIVEMEFSVADIILVCMAENLRREFDCFANTGPISCPLAEEIALAVEAAPGSKGAGEWVALAAINAELNRTFWRGFPWCCTRVAKKRKILIHARDRIVTQLNPLDRKPLKMVDIWAIPKLEEFVQVNDSCGFPVFDGPDYDYSKRRTEKQNKQCMDFMCCSGLYSHWPWAKAMLLLIVLFMGIGLPLVVSAVDPTVFSEIDRMPNTVYFVFTILISAILALIFLHQVCYHCFWAVKTGRRWRRMSKFQDDTYGPYVAQLRSVLTQAPQREHRQEEGKAFHENYVGSGGGEAAPPEEGREVPPEEEGAAPRN